MIIPYKFSYFLQNRLIELFPWVNDDSSTRIFLPSWWLTLSNALTNIAKVVQFSPEYINLLNLNEYFYIIQHGTLKFQMKLNTSLQIVYEIYMFILSKVNFEYGIRPTNFKKSHYHTKSFSCKSIQTSLLLIVPYRKLFLQTGVILFIHAIWGFGS